MDFTTLSILLSEDVDNRFECIIDYEEFQVWLDTNDHKYYYIECSENDASGCFEVEIVATLKYDVLHDLKIEHEKAGKVLKDLFDCDCCGEYVHDNGIEYLWFMAVERNSK